ncbi:MAG: sugar phosphate isomerase/epimerase [Clostridiales bacterium]|nr:sugar phosphate isomerase/epimerase [Clostridiales bacterium]
MSTIALQMYTLRNHMADRDELNETLSRVASIGYRNVQISIPEWLDARVLRSMLDSHGLKADSVLAPVGTIAANIDAIAETGEILGTDVARTTSIPTSLRDSADGYRKFCEQLNEEGRLLKERGLRRFFYHFHAFEFIDFDGVRGIDILLSDLDPAYVQFQPDVFWLTSAGTEPSSSLYLFSGRAEYMHVKDYAITRHTGKLEGVPRCFAPVGKGNLNWPGILKAAADIGIKRFVVEQDMCDGDPFECIQVSFNSLRAMGIEA